MASPFTNIVDRVKLSIARKFQQDVLAKRGYEAARYSRLESDWLAESNDINRELREAKDRIDRRAYELSKNNPYARGFVLNNKINIIGHEGFVLQCLSKFPSGEYDTFANNVIQNGFEKWSRKEFCTMSKRFSWLRVQWLVENMLSHNGEFLIKTHSKLSTEVNPFGFSMEILDPYDIDWQLTQEYNDNVIINGIEINQWREIKAVWLRSGKVTGEIYGVPGYSTKSIRVDAEELIYDFDPDHPKQTRGITPLSSVILSLRGVTRWEDYSLVNAQYSAAKMGFIYKKDATAGSYQGKAKNTTSANAAPGKYMDMAAGVIEELPLGYEYVGHDPKFPHEQHQPFLKAMLRKIATGLGLSYNSFANDLEGVNYSSMRSGLLNERGGHMLNQSFLREALCQPVYERWLKSALNSGALTPLYPNNYEKYLSHYFQGRRWGWVDPKSDVDAAAKSEKMGYSSKVDIVQEKGGSIEDIFRDRAYVKALAKKYDCPELTEFLSDKGTPVSNANGNNNNEGKVQ